MIFELTQDLTDAIAAIPQQHGKRRMITLLYEAMRLEIHFIACHPTTLFQCMWNTCWWYKTADATPGPTVRPLCEALENWHERKQTHTTGFTWLRSRRPPPTSLGTSLVATMRGHRNQVTRMAFAPDGLRLLSCSDDGTMRLWDSHSGAELFSMPLGDLIDPHSVQSVSFSSDGERVAAVGRLPYQLGGGGTVVLWDSHTLSTPTRLVGPIVKGFPTPSEAVRRIGAGGSAQGQPEFVLTPTSSGPAPEGYERVMNSNEEPAHCIGHSADLDKFAFKCADSVIRILSISSPRTLCLAYHDFTVDTLLRFGQHGLIATGSAREPLRVWLITDTGARRDSTRRTWISRHMGGSRKPRSIVCEPLWTARRVAVKRLEIAASGRLILGWFMDGTVRSLCAQTGHELACAPTNVLHLAYTTTSPDGARVFCSYDDGAYQLIDAHTLKEVQHGTIATDGAFSGRITRYGSHALPFQFSIDNPRNASHACFSDDGTKIGLRSGNSQANVLDTRTNQTVDLNVGGGTLYSMTFRPGTEQLATASRDRTIRLFDLAREAPPVIETACDPRFAPDGSTLVTHDGTRLVFWNVETGAQVNGNAVFACKVAVATNAQGQTVVMPYNHSDKSFRQGLQVDGFAFSQDGQKVMCWCSYCLNVWSYPSAQLLATVNGNGISTAVFSPDAAIVICGSDGGLIHVCDMKKPRYLCVTVPERPDRSHPSINAIWVSGDGTRAIASLPNGGVCSVDLTSGAVLGVFNVGWNGRVLGFAEDDKGIRVATSHGIRTVSMDGEELALSSRENQQHNVPWPSTVEGDSICAITPDPHPERLPFAGEVAYWTMHPNEPLWAGVDENHSLFLVSLETH